MTIPTNHIIKHLTDIDEQERKLVIDRALTLEKAFTTRDVDTILKAQNYQMSRQRQSQPQNYYSSDSPYGARPDGMKSMVVDPYESNSSLGYYHKNTQLSFEALRSMSRTPIIRAIINTRKREVMDFCKRQPDKYSKGFTFVKEGVDEDDLEDKDKRVQDQLTKFIMACGDEENKWDLDDFDNFIKKLVDDSLSLDQATAEVIPNRAGVPSQFLAVDAATFRIAETYGQDESIKQKAKVNGYLPKYVQLWQGNIVAEFYPWELIFGIRNPSTNVRSAGYGRSELEDLIITVTSMLNADAYNGKFFRNGVAPSGALLVKKAQGLNNNTINQFRKDWNSMLSGEAGWHKTPILDAESVEWLDMRKSNRDMEFSKFQEYLIRLACAMYIISPEEIGFPLGGTGNQGLGSKEGGKDEKEYSQDKGLKPLLTEIEQWLNKHIIGPKTNNIWKFKFVGLDIESAKDEEERLQKEVTLWITPDEIRKQKGKKPLPNGVGRLPLNPIIAQQVQMQQQQQMESQQKQQEQEDEQRNNTNPFLDDNSPFAKGFNEFVQKELVIG